MSQVPPQTAAASQGPDTRGTLSQDPASSRPVSRHPNWLCYLLVPLLGLVLITPPLAASWITESAAVAPAQSGGQDDEKKKRKKQRGKVVKARVVPSEPASTETAAEEAAAPSATPSEPEASAPDASAEAKATKKAEKAERQRAKREAAEREQEERQAAKQREEDARAQQRLEQREAAQAAQAEQAAAARGESEERAAAKSEAASEARARKEAAAAQKAADAEARRTERAEQAAVKPEPKVTSPAVAPTPTPKPAAVRAPEPAARRAATPAADRPPSTSTTRSTPADVSETIEVREVLLDVLVTDRKGNVIEGLDKSDFEVTEDGKPVEVTSLVYYGGVEELQSEGIGETRTDRYFILMFHDQAQAAPFLRAAQMDNGRWAQKWIENELQPNDQVAVLGYDVRLKVYQDFSTDPVLLSQAVNAAVLGQKEPDRWRTREADPQSDGSPSLLINLPKGKALSQETRRLQQALELLGRASEGIIGRKNLMLFSAGFGDIGDIGVWTPDPRFYPPMKESLNTGNVAVYSIDLLGSRRGNPGARDINDGLSALSTDTGGHYYSTFANAMAPLRNVSEDNLGYYLISYRSQFETGTSGYREVKVKVDNAGIGKKLKVRGRKGYRFGT